MRVLVIDNYDSFVYNLVQYLAQLGAECEVRRNDAVSAADFGSPGAGFGPVDGVLLSPGPGTPERAGACMEVIRACRDTGRPVFGVCLGHQAIGAVWGAVIERAKELLHGKTSQVYHEGAGVLAGLPSPFRATRYHSLAVREGTLPPEFEVTGRTESGVIMAMRHRELPIESVQFHPESVLTEYGHRLLANWMASCGHPVSDELVSRLEAEVRQVAAAAYGPAATAEPARVAHLGVP